MGGVRGKRRSLQLDFSKWGDRGEDTEATVRVVRAAPFGSFVPRLVAPRPVARHLVFSFTLYVIAPLELFRFERTLKE